METESEKRNRISSENSARRMRDCDQPYADFKKNVVLTYEDLWTSVGSSPIGDFYATAIHDLNDLAEAFMFGVYLRGMRDKVVHSNVRGQSRCFRNTAITLQSYRVPGPEDLILVKLLGHIKSGTGGVIFRGYADADNPKFALLNVNATLAHVENMVRIVREDWKKLTRPDIEGLSDSLDAADEFDGYVDEKRTFLGYKGYGYNR